PLQRLTAVNSGQYLGPIAEQAVRLFQLELLHHVAEVMNAARAHTHLAGESIDEEHIEPEPSKPDQILQKDPRVPCMRRLLCDGACEDDARFHPRRSGTACGSSTAASFWEDCLSPLSGFAGPRSRSP